MLMETNIPNNKIWAISHLTIQMLLLGLTITHMVVRVSHDNNLHNSSSQHRYHMLSLVQQSTPVQGNQTIVK